ncbi:LysR family transcriptional regulator [Eleftheria terrae]|uniref:LysR family transcriptional regulator n=1 Tax=Eleftheria terrae TaxID=1597781 RepID=UPI003F4D8EA5
MSIENLRGIEAFIKAVDHGSIAAAARRLGITPAAASQSIARLERQLGARLLLRTTRSLALTDAGQVYFARVRDTVMQLEHAHAAVTELCGEAQGELKIACSVAFGRHVVAPLIPAFAERHPRVATELLLTDFAVDHVKEDVDVSIRFNAQLEPGLVARRIATVPIFLCASPDYLRRAGRPLKPEALREHACLVFRLPVHGRLLPWGFVRGGERFEPELRPTVVSNDIDALAAMAVAGAGIARLGSFVAGEHLAAGRLEALFATPCSTGAHADPEPLEFFACWRDRQYVSPKVRAFVDFISEALHGHPRLQPPALPRKAGRRR